MSIIHIFGGKPIPKVLDFFRVNSFWDYSLRDVSKETGISYRSLQEIIPRFVEAGILVQTRTEGKAKMYKFNSENRLSEQIQDIAIESDLQFGEALAKKETLEKPIPL
ncbi:MAG: hypothetical protein KKB03_03100 [Nanoarchaeota archaeon]|nr:hypothetical protein [Nanoarchaeota archaeon]MBU1135806.1 hypothetical protein [Nanoarchaeota archaeon]MBU2520202.1 hypothetical protein [Nanoarchaeota archaeon]